MATADVQTVPGVLSFHDVGLGTGLKAEQGMTGIMNVNGVLTKVTDAGTQSGIGGAGGTEAAWFASTLARITALVPTLTEVVMKDEGGSSIVNWDLVEAGTGTARPSAVSTSAWDIQQGATSGGLGALTLKGGGTGGQIIPNGRTTKMAIAVRVTKIANIATSDLRIANLSDGTAFTRLGIVGATSQVNYTLKVGSGGVVDLGVAQSAAGTYDTVILLNDGTNFFADINGAAAGAAQSAATMTTLQAFPQLLATGGANANTGFRVDKVMVVVEPAS